MYNNEGNNIFSAEVDGAGNIIVTTVYYESNTLATMVDDKTNSIASVNIDNDPFILKFFYCSDDDASYVASSQSFICYKCRCSYPKLY